MNNIKKYLIVAILLLLSASWSYAQVDVFNQANQKKRELLTIRGSVYDKETREPYNDVTIYVAGGAYTQTSIDGTFRIKAEIGDELTISHDEFETIYYVIKSSERLEIQVTDNRKSKDTTSERGNISLFKKLIDSADTYLKRDAAKSIEFVGKALAEDVNSRQSAEAHELLGDIHTFWKQHDLAISAYVSSIQKSRTPSAELKLASAYFNNGEYQKSLSSFQAIKERKLSNYQKVELYEGIGDAYLKLQQFDNSLEAYNKGLKLAQKHLIAPKVTDLNSKIAEAYSEQGNKNEAQNFYGNSLKLAKQENKKRAVIEQAKVADFNNAIEDYESEISIRKEAIETIKDIEADSIIPNPSPLTVQKQNYKIGNAYLQQRDYDSAITYLEESIKEADEKEDLEVQKDAILKLSEAHFNKGDTDKGREAINEFKNIVDELYIKKNQEISQAARFRKNIADQQNRITLLESDRELSMSKYELTQERNKSQQLIIYSLFGGLILLMITGYFMYKYIRQQKLANNLLALKSLRTQMNPHFIFNALNSVNSFIARNDERTANKYLSDFSHLMRSVLENSEEDFISLKKEIELIEVYTKLEHFRFQDKFDYTIEVDETINAENFMIPPMLLQPYIENAVWHGLRYKKEKGFLNIAIQPKSETQITITISDNGIGRTRSKALKTEHQKKQNSKGMNNIKKRVYILNKMYKDRVGVEIGDLQNEDDAGTKVTVTLKKN